MGYNIVYRKEIDTLKWNRLIETHAEGLPYALSWYLDIATDNQWCALIDSDYKAGIPLPWNQKIPGYKQIYTPFFVQQLGFFGNEPLTLENWINLTKFIPASFKRIQINFNEKNFPGEVLTFPFTKKTNLVLPLQSTYERLFNQYSRSLRRNVRLTQKEGLKLGRAATPKEVVQLYMDQLDGKQPAINKKAFNRLEKIMQTLLEKNMGEIFTCIHPSGQICGATFIIGYKSRLINLVNTQNQLGRESKAGHFLLDQIIRKYASSSRLLDFEGSNIAGIADFFKSFGATHQDYYAVELNRFSTPESILFQILQKFKAKN